MKRLDKGCISVRRGENYQNFKFRTIYKEETRQQEVFEPVKELVDSAVDQGINISVFAYG